jgi:integrase/recombinase XerD
MNRRPSGLAISKAIPGFLQYKVAEGLSPNTIKSYERHLLLWLEYQGDMDVSRVTTRHLREYLHYMHTEYKPRRSE